MQLTFSLVVFEYFLLVFARIVSFTAVAPFFSIRGVPVITRIGFSAIIAYMVTVIMQPTEVIYVSVLGYAVLVLKEVLTGILIGFVGNICLTIVNFAGNVIDMNIGLSMVSEFDPTQNTQLTVTGQMYYYFVLLLLLVTDMHRFVISAVIESFRLIPLGGAAFEWDNILNALVRYLADYVYIAFMIMMPVFAVMLVANVILGVMAKVAPQMNMFSVGVQIKILLGFATLFLTVFLFPKVIEMISGEMRQLIPEIIQGMY